MSKIFNVTGDCKPNQHYMVDISDKNIKMKIRPENEHKTNSPWIAREDNEPCESLLSFGDCPRDHMVLVPYDIAADFDVDMSLSVNGIAGSEDFPDKSSAWTHEGLLNTVRMLLAEPNMLFDSLLHKLDDHPELKRDIFSHSILTWIKK